MYEQLCSYENLELAFKRARRGKTLKPYVIEFEEKLKENLLQLQTELLSQTYKPEPLKTFIIRDPKTRKISKSAFRDRIVHHAICNIIEYTFDKRFIYDSFANRLRKGTLHAIKRFDHFKRKVSQNNTIKCYVLKADIKQYFETVDHEILLTILQKRIKNDKLVALIRKILVNYLGNVPGVGMPLGNLTSQFFANVYLNELDQFVKHKLRAKYYIRYVDDFVILHHSQKLLEKYKAEIDTFLQQHLVLNFHPQKSQVIKLHKGINFLGFRIFYHHRLLRKKNIKKFERKFEVMKDVYQQGLLDREKAVEKFEGWLAYASQGNTYKYRTEMMGKFNRYFPAQKEIQVTSVKKHENFNQKIEANEIDFTFQKTLYLFKKGLTVSEISQQRGLQESTIWAHLAYLVELHQLQLKEVLTDYKIKTILSNIKNPNDTLRQVKERVDNDAISYDEINCVLANIKGKHRQKSMHYYIEWYKRVNCFRKCYFNKKQRAECRNKFQILAAKSSEMKFTKKEFLEFFHNHVNICVLSDKEKKRFMSWREFQSRVKGKKDQMTSFL